MTKASRQLSEDSKKVLHSTIGKRIECFRVIKDHEKTRPIGLVVVDFDDGSSIEIRNSEDLVPFFDGKEELNGFSCKEFDDRILERIPFDKNKVPTSTIKSIDLITDKIVVHSNKFEDYIIIIDAGIIINGDKHSYIFALDKVFFFEQILCSVDGNFEEMRPLGEVKKYWEMGDHIIDAEITRASEQI